MKTFTAFVLMTFALALPRGWAQAPPASPEQTVIALETSWSQAAIARDRTVLDRFYADEYIFTNEDGVTTNRTKEIANITSGTFRLTAFRFNDLKVHVYGDVSVVTGENDIKGTWEDINKDISGPYRFTDVFVKRNSRWQCVASQSSRITPRKELP
jgi:ketosteroid isomerase-like protein